MLGIIGEAEIHSELPSIVGTLVTATIEGWGQKAWIAEFGSGSIMAKANENPYLSAYKSSGNYNPLRLSDGSITGRPKGVYYDLDGYRHESSGSAAGRDLELKPVVTVMYPAHVIAEEIQSAMPELVIEIQSAVAGYAVAQMTMTTEIYI